MEEKYKEIKDIEWYQTSFRTMPDKKCFDDEMAKVADSDDEVDSDCEYRLDGWANTAGTNESASAYYYDRGFGVLGIKGSDEYTEFSKAVFQDEFTLTNNPNLMFTFSGEEEGQFQLLPVAALVWRYMQSYHSGLPSGHDVITGMWEPSEAETAAGLKGPHDFCTFVNVVASAYLMKEKGCAILMTTDESGNEV